MSKDFIFELASSGWRLIFLNWTRVSRTQTHRKKQIGVFLFKSIQYDLIRFGYERVCRLSVLGVNMCGICKYICVCARDSVCICFYLFIYNKFFFLFFWWNFARHVSKRVPYSNETVLLCYENFYKINSIGKKTKDGKKNDEYTDENRKTLSPPYRKRRMCCCVQPLAVSSSSVNRTLKIFHGFSHTLSCSLRKFSQFTVHVREMQCMCECYTVIFKFPVRMFTSACMSTGEQRKPKQPFGTNPFTTMNARRMCRCRGA